MVGVLPLVLFKSRLFGRQLVSLPMLNYGGLLLEDPAAAGPLVARAAEIARRFGAAHVELRQQEKTTGLPARQHKVSMRRGLPDTTDALWNSIDRKVRNQVRKAQKADLSVSIGGRELVGDFYRVFSENMRDLGTPVYSRRLFEGVLEAFPERARLHVVRHAGRPIAASCVLRFRDTDLVPWASSLRAERHLCPNMLLYWSMMEAAVMRGATVFDFGRSSPDAGTAQFKLQWGAEAAPQSWEYVLLKGGALPEQGPAGGRFSLAVEAWKRLPLWIANAAGPHVVRNIP
jgi:FemAB-related protein (PEP-CTERM system-associated)